MTDAETTEPPPPESPPTPVPSIPRPRWLSLLPLATVPLFWASFFPLNQGWLAYAALAPWFAFLILETRIRRVALMTWLTWFCFFSFSLKWLRFTTGYGIFAISGILGLELLILAYLVRRMLARRNDPLTWTAMAAMFIGWEWLRCYLYLGFPWYLVGHSQHAYLPLAQCADLGGVALLGFPAAWTSALVAGLFARRLAGLPPGRDLAYASCAVAALLALLTGYGLWRLNSLPKNTALRVGLVQGNVPQDIKDLERAGAWDPHESFRNHIRLSQDVRQSSDLVVWAETMYPYKITPRHPPNEEALHELAKELQRPMLVGVLLDDPQGREFNSALYVDASGKRLGRYDKRHLVMVAEYIPFRDSMPWLFRFLERITNLKHIGALTPGESLDVFEARGRKFGVLICYDSMWPDESLSYADDGADFLVTISNDGWFKESEQLDLILSVAALRCIETRLGMARCTNTGISAFIGADGRVTEFAVGGATKSVKGSVSGPVAGRCGESVYVRVGDWFAKGCVVLTGLVGLWSCWPRKRASGQI